MMRRGFSLVELSIVLVILGLLTGGILAGQSLIKAAAMRATTTELHKYRTAALIFKDKYFAVPGDMTSATKFWTSLSGTGSDAACQNAEATGLPTCDGNGDGRVLTSVVTGDETYRFWQHLANAGLIEGNYTGSPTNPTAGRQNLPLGRFESTVWYTQFSLAGPGGNVNFFPVPDGNWLSLNKYGQNINVAGSCPFTPEEAWNVDTKLDDGKPGNGNIMVSKGNNTSSKCTTVAGTTTDTGAEYRLDIASKDCVMYYYRAY